MLELPTSCSIRDQPESREWGVLESSGITTKALAQSHIALVTGVACSSVPAAAAPLGQRFANRSPPQPLNVDSHLNKTAASRKDPPIETIVPIPIITSKA